jgi:stress-induced-phosphoprotein 1
MGGNDSVTHGILKDWKQAAEDAKECIRLDPSFLKGYYRLATAKIELKDYEGAMATIRQGLVIDPNNTQLTKQMRLAQQQQKVEKAKASSSSAMASAVPSVRATAALDEATARELQELQTQYAQTVRELQTAQANLIKTQKEHKVTEITTEELQEIPGDDVPCYRSIGKMFWRTSKPDMLACMQTNMEQFSKQEKDLSKKMEYLERQIQSQRQNMEELLGNAAEASS